MRRQRYVYTLPSQDDSTAPPDSDDTSFISSPYSYPETILSHMSPDPETIPYWICQYPTFQVTTDPFQNISGFIAPHLTPSSLCHYSDEFSDVYDFITSPPFCETSYEDGFTTEDYSFDESFPFETTENIPREIPYTYPMVTNYGAITILLRHLVRVDISPAKSVYVTNPPASCVAAINGTGDRSCIIHPNGRILQEGHDIHMETLNRRAKMCKRGIVFTSNDHCLSYIVDASGTKTTSEKFRDLKQDFSLEIFYNDSMTCSYVEECHKMLNESIYKRYFNGDEVWFLGGFRIKQDQRGDVKVSRNDVKQVIRSSPTTGQVSVKTIAAELSICRYPNSYFAVRKGNEQVSASIKGFNVQCGTQKAGFNSSGKVVLF